MREKIWRILAQLLYNHNDSLNILKPFFENLKNDNINDEKYIPFLKTFSKYQLENLYQNRILTDKIYSYLLKPYAKKDQNQLSLKKDNIEEIISGDKIKELQELFQRNNIQQFLTITKSFKEVDKIRIPLIQYCIMKKAIECFKYLLINGYDDPNKTMQEPYRKYIDNYQNQSSQKNIEVKIYDWDCMATAIYFGNREIMKILEDKGMKKGSSPTHVEAAMLSYRNKIAEEILEEKKTNWAEINDFFKEALIASTKSNNIAGEEFLLKKDVDLDMHDQMFN